MANPQKAKGDKGEREAVEILVALAPDLARDNAMRMLGAGRKDDIGDIAVFDDVAIQVKTWANLTRACREAADGAVQQQKNGRSAHHLGLAPIPRARTGVESLRWLATMYAIPDGKESWEPLPTFGLTTDAVKHLSTGYPGRVPLTMRACVVRKTGLRPLYMMPLQAWVACYRQTKNPMEPTS